jgi:small subunit ribosomal protein S1
MTESFAELFEESFASQQIKPGAIITGTVVAVNDDVVLVSAGLKSEAVISIEQFYNDLGETDVAVGDEVEVALDAVENGFGETVLSREKAIRARTWTELEKAFEKGEVVTGMINGRVKGGFTVEIDNVRAFLPGSLVDVRPVRDPAYLEGKSLEFKVIKLDQRRNNVVVSRRAVVEQEYSAEREALLEGLQEGNTVKGIVKNLTDYGAFVDLGGIDGLLHITDMAWKRVKHPSEVVNVGEEIDVKILKFDRERQRVSLGIKQLGDDPWHDLARRYPPQSRLFGKITNIADYGCFVEIEEGVEGLVHVSEMDWTNKNVNPSRVVQVGEEVEVMVLEIDEERRRMVKSSRSPTSGSLSVSMAALTAWCTCPIFHGTCPVRKRCATTRKGRRSRLQFWPSTPSASAYPWASSSLTRIRSPRGLPRIRRTRSSKGRSPRSTRAARLWISATV